MAINDITGDKLITKTASTAYRDGWDRIFGRKEVQPEPVKVKPPVVELVVSDAEQQRLQEDARRAAWHKWLQQNQGTLKTIPTFEEWAAKNL
jgi:hypothetical protein